MKTAVLAEELDALRDLVAARLGDQLDGPRRPMRHIGFDTSLFAELNDGRDLSPEEHVVVLLALVPHLRADFFGRLIAQYLPDGGDLPSFGGVRGEHHRGVLPTGETAQFVLAGDELERRLAVQHLLASDHWFSRRRVLWLDAVREGEPLMSGRLVLDPEVVELLMTGRVSLPRFSTEFPAERVETGMRWEDLVLRPETLQQVHEIEHWVHFNDVLRTGWGMSTRIRPGYLALFHGPPGTGKTLTAALLGRSTGRPVLRVDLSRVVSKYIGETEKNLARLFDKAERRGWILFFDEADALFSKRAEIRDSHDRYANQEVAYLLQRVEGYAGLVILATNQRGNVDNAFLRRFQSVIHFPMPRAEDRHEIWRRVFPPQLSVAGDVDWRDVSRRFELTAAGIVNVVHFCALEALAADRSRVDRAALESAIIRELVKEGKIV